jgi:hypothetical protein
MRRLPLTWIALQFEGGFLMDPKAVLLCDRLEQIVCLLDQVEERHWAAWARAVLSRISNDELDGVHDLLAAYGGMGSFNDLVIHALNGHKVASDEYIAVNDHLERLRNETFELASSISHGE